MTPPFTITLLRLLYTVFLGCMGAMIGFQFGSIYIGAACALVLGLFVVLLDSVLKGISLRVFSSATFGLVLGLFFATLLRASNVLIYLEEDKQWAVGVALYCVFGYLGMMLAMRSNREEFSLIIPYVRFSKESVQTQPVILDTNIVIDGRVAEICQIGFLSKQLVVPRFVVEELHQLADSHDTITRDRGKRGLSNLSAMEQNPDLNLSIYESVSEEASTVDIRLLHLSRLLRAQLLTNDGDLTKTARLQGISALNLNSLTTALRPVLAPGDTLELNLVREGREDHQAVGFIQDGTMVVVNNARAQLGTTVKIIVAGTTQTNAGRLIFAELDNKTAPSKS